MPGLRRSSSLIVVLNCVAIENSVSPVLTVHITCCPLLVVVVSWVVVVDWVVDSPVLAGVVAPVLAGGGGGAVGTGGGSGGGGAGGGAVSGTESVSTGPEGAVEGGAVPSEGCPIQPALDKINTITVTAPSNAAGAR
jgi:hypothetical protein